ncbi:MAG: hypothetical protein Q8K58_08940 [Acidimicrobiales bacterium]|nr:hypothetical protein [Acidimicrobiales bacterium]
MLLSLLERLALHRRRPGSHPAWTAVALAAFLLRRLRSRQVKESIALREELRPGETLIITHTAQRQG